MRQKIVALMSGGMDSTTALYIACTFREADVRALFFDYGQRGAVHEMDAASQVLSHMHKRGIIHSFMMHSVDVKMPASSALTDHRGNLDPECRREDGLPATFVPGRNMIQLSYAASLAYGAGADVIVGGWTAVDVDYPDCRHSFLVSMRHTISLALGTDQSNISIEWPLLNYGKYTIVSVGEALGVPFELTRSCYGSDKEPCMKCDSCLKRANGFHMAGLRDPIVDKVRWNEFVNGG
jgi:7-cyano-7-deazaguanine synthase